MSDQDISDAYLYLLGRLLVLRQEQLDLRTDSSAVRWNHLVHRRGGLDVACSDAWIGIDETSCTIVGVPAMGNRYYTIHALNAWGETLTNINERNYPGHLNGSFAFCPRGARIALPSGTIRIDLPCRKARIIARIELGTEPTEAIALQHQLTMRASASPRVASAVRIPMFSTDALPGSCVFDTAPSILASEPDINPDAATLQQLVRMVAATAAGGSAERARIDGVIRTHALPHLEQAIAEMGQTRSGWSRPRVIGNYGEDWLMRTVANLVGIWANTPAEMISFETDRAAPLDGSTTYAMTFPPDDLPSSRVGFFWSASWVSAVDSRPLSEQRSVLSSRMPLRLAADGALTLYFAPERPLDAPAENWVPTPADTRYVATWRSYGPDEATIHGRWFPPALIVAPR